MVAVAAFYCICPWILRLLHPEPGLARCSHRQNSQRSNYLTGGKMHFAGVDCSCFGYLNCQDLRCSAWPDFLQNPPPRCRNTLPLPRRVHHPCPLAPLLYAQ
ncbi:hypothetical protein B0H16DRAFT_1639903 [Mycena metata]|uniref:Secreted protein n=1 Tax=Mycena metata TaxID=1033252 RepID=A0AAD7GQ52_9AGAR|nr:hypothetical protein B0H16DRAFT_1639903 [Mycena metata]